jgi:hypothetical protein
MLRRPGQDRGGREYKERNVGYGKRRWWSVE